MNKHSKVNYSPCEKVTMTVGRKDKHSPGQRLWRARESGTGEWARWWDSAGRTGWASQEAAIWAGTWGSRHETVHWKRVPGWGAEALGQGHACHAEEQWGGQCGWSSIIRGTAGVDEVRRATGPNPRRASQAIVKVEALKDSEQRKHIIWLNSFRRTTWIAVLVVQGLGRGRRGWEWGDQIEAVSEIQVRGNSGLSHGLWERSDLAHSGKVCLSPHLWFLEL